MPAAVKTMPWMNEIIFGVKGVPHNHGAMASARTVVQVERERERESN